MRSFNHWTMSVLFNLLSKNLTTRLLLSTFSDEMWKACSAVLDSKCSNTSLALFSSSTYATTTPVCLYDVIRMILLSKLLKAFDNELLLILHAWVTVTGVKNFWFWTVLSDCFCLANVFSCRCFSWILFPNFSTCCWSRDIWTAVGWRLTRLFVKSLSNWLFLSQLNLIYYCFI